MIIILFEDVNEKDAVRHNVSAPAPPVADKTVCLLDRISAFVSRYLHPIRSLLPSRVGSVKK